MDTLPTAPIALPPVSTPTARHRVLILDDQYAMCDLLRLFLKAEMDGYEIAGQTSSAEEALNLSCRQAPDIVLFDVCFNDLPPLTFIERLKESAPRARLLVFSRWSHPDFTRAFISAGVHGLIFKHEPLQTVRHALNALSSGGMYFSSSIEENRRAANGGRGALTEREKSALCLIAEGHSTKEMASVLNISVKTAEKYRERIMGKLDLHDAVQLTHFAIRNGLVAP